MSTGALLRPADAKEGVPQRLAKNAAQSRPLLRRDRSGAVEILPHDKPPPMIPRPRVGIAGGSYTLSSGLWLASPTYPTRPNRTRVLFNAFPWMIS